MSAFGWKKRASPMQVRCARNGLGAIIRSLQSAYAAECEEHAHRRQPDTHWLRSFLTELFPSGDILPSRRR